MNSSRNMCTCTCTCIYSVLCCFALFVRLTLLAASSFLPSHLSLKHVLYSVDLVVHCIIIMYNVHCRVVGIHVYTCRVESDEGIEHHNIVYTYTATRLAESAVTYLRGSVLSRGHCLSSEAGLIHLKIHRLNRHAN